MFRGVLDAKPSAARAEVGEAETAARQVGANVFEFCLVFWAPSAERIEQEVRRQQACAEVASMRGGGATRGGPPPAPALDAEMRWALRANDLTSQTSYAFKKTRVFPGVSERVGRLGAQLDLTAKVAGAYEVELGAGFSDGVYVPSLMAAGKAKNKTHGPFVGLHRVEDLSREMLVWAKDRGW